MRRREFITLLGAAAAWPLAVRAQQGQRNKQIRIGFLASAAPTPEMLSAFRDGLRERGYVEGQNFSIADRWPQGSFEQLSDIAADLNLCEPARSFQASILLKSKPMGALPMLETPT